MDASMAPRWLARQGRWFSGCFPSFRTLFSSSGPPSVRRPPRIAQDQRSAGGSILRYPCFGAMVSSQVTSPASRRRWLGSPAGAGGSSSPGIRTISACCRKGSRIAVVAGTSPKNWPQPSVGRLVVIREDAFSLSAVPRLRPGRGRMGRGVSNSGSRSRPRVGGTSVRRKPDSSWRLIPRSGCIRGPDSLSTRAQPKGPKWRSSSEPPSPIWRGWFT